MLPTKNRTSLVLSIALATASCATGPDGKSQGLDKTFKDTFASEDPCSNNARNIGIVGGAVLGTVLAKALGNGKTDTLVVGAGLGALVGGMIGADMDRRRCELTKVAKAHNLDIVMTDIRLATAASAPVAKDVQATPGTPAATAPALAAASESPPPAVVAGKKPEPIGMSLTIADHGKQFATGSALPSADAIKAFAAVADQYHVLSTGQDALAVQAALMRNKHMRILLIGHTDDTGSSELNADLSEERARAIAKIFAQRGFSPDQIFYQGAGEVFPIADNASDEGRARNRRVEIVDLSDDAAFAAFLAARRPNVAHYRPAVQTKPALSSTLSSVASAPAAVDKLAEARKPSASIASSKSSVTAGKPPVVVATTPAATAASASAKATKPAASSSAGGKPAGVAAAPVPASATAKTAMVPVPALVNIDLGGKPANGQFRVADIGKAAQASSFSIISSAYAADESPVGSCATDRPRISRGVKSLGTGQVIKTSEYLPGAANASWGGRANGHLLGLSGVAVLRDGGQPASHPTFFVWKNFVEGSKAPADLKTTADVNAYQGDKALLYRVFLTEGPVRCIDLVIPKGAANTAPASSLVYERNSAIYQADYSPTIVR